MVNIVRTGTPDINRDADRQDLGSIVYPIAFLDYEAVITAVPQFKGYRPNQNMAFQYSLHIVRSEDADIEHYEFLADGQGDLRAR